MIAFTEPPRRPNRWFEDAPVVAVLRPRQNLLRRVAVPLGFVAALAGTIVVIAQLPPSPSATAERSGFARNRQFWQAEKLLWEQLGRTPTLRRVRATMTDAGVHCRAAEGRASDSLLVCLGHAVRFDGAYTRMAFRFVSRGDSVTQVVVCPAIVVSRKRRLPVEVQANARPSLRDATCWRDPDWTWAALPDPGQFTTVPEPDAPRLRAESNPSADTILVIW